MTGGEVAHYRVENGTVQEFTLPVPGWARQRVTIGVWRRVNSDGTDWAPAPDAPPPLPPKPVRSDPKSLWIGYAVAVGGMALNDAEGLNKHELIERFGGPETPSAGGDGG